MMLSHEIAEQFKLEMGFKPDKAEWQRRVRLYWRLHALGLHQPFIYAIGSQADIAQFEQKRAWLRVAMTNLLKTPLEDGVEWYVGASDTE